MILEILAQGVEAFLTAIPILVFAVVIGQLILAYIPAEKTERLLIGNGINIVIASAIGLFSPGPNAAYLPLLYTLRSRGASLSIIIAFITSQTMVGPVRFFLEAEYFGVMFWVYRLIIVFFIAIAMGFSYKILGHRLEPPYASQPSPYVSPRRLEACPMKTPTVKPDAYDEKHHACMRGPPHDHHHSTSRSPHPATPGTGEPYVRVRSRQSQPRQVLDSIPNPP